MSLPSASKPAGRPRLLLASLLLPFASRGMAAVPCPAVEKTNTVSVIVSVIVTNIGVFL